MSSKNKENGKSNAKENNDKTSKSTSASSTISTESTASTGIGSGTPNEQQRTDLPPKLTPEGLSLDPNIKIYDAIVYLIYCPEHDKIAVTNVERARCVWLPFASLPEGITWIKASHQGVAQIIGNKDAELDAAVSAKKAPVYDMTYLNVLRIQLPSEKFVTRLANIIFLKKSPTSTFKCCERSPRINWLRASDIIGDRIDKVWGPELRNFTKLLMDITSGQHEAIISEFSLENSFHYLMLDNSPEQKLLRSSHVKPEHIMEIYENYIEHCYPSFYMAFESFKFYLIKYGFDKNEETLLYLFNAFSMYGNDYLDFHEVLLGIVAMEPTTKHLTEARLKFIFRYYDSTRSGYLTLDEFVVMVQDIHKKSSDGKEVNLSDEELKAKVEESVKCVGMKDQQIALANFLKAVLSNSFKNTDKLCRSPKAILPQISRLLQARNEGKNKSTKEEGFLTNHRKKKGICFRCQAQSYDYCLHNVTFDTVGRCVEPRIISEQWIDPVAENSMNFHKYSIEYVFRNSSVPNIFIDMVKEFNYKYQMDNSIKGLLSAKEDWTIFSKYMNMLCEELKGLLMCEDKLIKLNSPAVVVGDLQGNLNDLFSVESSYFQSFPVIANNIIFLGNYSGVYPHGIECITYLFSLKLCSPNKIFLLRGTSEMKSQNKRTLLQECTHKYGTEYGRRIFEMINDIFERMPFGVIIDENIFCAHSGIPKSCKISKLNQLDHDIASVVKEAPVAYELLVNTPLGIDDCLNNVNPSIRDSMKNNDKKIAKNGSSSSKTFKKPSKNLQIGSIVGVSGFTPSSHYLNAFMFDETAFDNFINVNNLSHFIRSHNVIPNDGFDLRFQNRCITIFTCSNYLQQCAKLDGKNEELKPEELNEATVAFVDGGNMQIRLLTFDSKQDVPVPNQMSQIL